MLRKERNGQSPNVRSNKAAGMMMTTFELCLVDLIYEAYHSGAGSTCILLSRRSTTAKSSKIIQRRWSNVLGMDSKIFQDSRTISRCSLRHCSFAISWSMAGIPSPCRCRKRCSIAMDPLNMKGWPDSLACNEHDRIDLWSLFIYVYRISMYIISITCMYIERFCNWFLCNIKPGKWTWTEPTEPRFHCP